MIQKSLAIEKFLDQYLHLRIAGKKVRCPYWKDRFKEEIWGPFGGKGKPYQIIGATLKIAREQKISLDKLTLLQIRRFMKKNRIGIDCSGLAYWLLDALDREKGGDGLEDDIPNAQGRFLIRADVRMLTNDKVSAPIKKIPKIQVGDMIKLHKGKHIAVIIRIKKVRYAIKELIYAHSSNVTRTEGFMPPKS